MQTIQQNPKSTQFGADGNVILLRAGDIPSMRRSKWASLASHCGEVLGRFGWARDVGHPVDGKLRPEITTQIKELEDLWLRHLGNRAPQKDQK
uniref:Uncharacterized protein n=1 Tax=Romanomermis culicivorax TaxID=13658 RepID=A0A915L1V3_ROMCU